MQIGDIVAISPWKKGHSFGIVLKQRADRIEGRSVFVHWVNPNGLGVAGLAVWEFYDKLEVINESR